MKKPAAEKPAAGKSAAKTAPASAGLPTAALEVKKMGTNLGAEIRGLDLTAPLDDATVEALLAAHVEHQLLVFPGQNLDGEQLMAFGRRIGELSVHPFSTNLSDTPELIVYDNKPENPPLATDVWHTDETFRPEPPMGTVLCSKIVPEIGGDTVFASMTAAYEGLSDRMQSFISGLEAVHDFKPFKTLFGESPEDRAKLQHFEKLHPPATIPWCGRTPFQGSRRSSSIPSSRFASRAWTSGRAARCWTRCFTRRSFPNTSIATAGGPTWWCSGTTAPPSITPCTITIPIAA
ncbi:MAG: TauD/TfdA family dioxygenase, partial [bacterium]